MGLATVMQTALSGMRAATAIVDATAHNVANLQTRGFKRLKVSLATSKPQTLSTGNPPRAGNAGTNPVQIGRGVFVAAVEVDNSPGPLDAFGNELSNVDLGQELIELTLAGNMFRANAAVFRTADELLGELFVRRR